MTDALYQHDRLMCTTFPDMDMQRSLVILFLAVFGTQAEEIPDKVFKKIATHQLLASCVGEETMGENDMHFPFREEINSLLWGPSYVPCFLTGGWYIQVAEALEECMQMTSNIDLFEGEDFETAPFQTLVSNIPVSLGNMFESSCSL